MNDPDQKSIPRQKFERRKEGTEAYRDPRKHYVRVYGWLPTASKRIQQIRQSTNSAQYLRYFTLCGPEILDVKFLATKGLLRKTERGYPDVAFCEEDADSYADAISRLRSCLLQLKKTFEDAVLQNKLDTYYPFDIYNLDFSRSCFPRGEPPTSRTMNAVAQLMAKQSEKKRSFDMFLTFRAEYGSENREALEALMKYMQKNFEEKPELLNAFKKKFGMELDQLKDRRYQQFILVTFPKFVAFRAQDYGFKLTQMQRFWYPRDRPDIQGSVRYYITKFVFSFDFVPVRPGIRREDRRTEQFRRNYLAIAEQSIQNNPVDVMNKLTNDIRSRLKEEVQTLLFSN